LSLVEVLAAVLLLSLTAAGAAAIISSTASNYASAPSSNERQVIVAVPQAGTSTSVDYVRVYRDNNGNIFAQRHDDSGAGTRMMDGPATMVVNYFRTATTTAGTATTTLEGAPDTATQVQLSVTATRANVSTRSVVYVHLRNTTLGL
jgi:hypothetical protein